MWCISVTLTTASLLTHAPTPVAPSTAPKLLYPLFATTQITGVGWGTAPEPMLGLKAVTEAFLCKCTYDVVVLVPILTIYNKKQVIRFTVVLPKWFFFSPVHHP
jgi:hypothetical protein